MSSQFSPYEARMYLKSVVEHPLHSEGLKKTKDPQVKDIQRWSVRVRHTSDIADQKRSLL
jgi:hypothetical protein